MSDTNNNEVNASSVENTAQTAVNTTPVTSQTPVAPVAVPAQAVSSATNDTEIPVTPTPEQPVKENTPVQKSSVESTEENKPLFYYHLSTQVQPDNLLPYI